MTPLYRAYPDFNRFVYIKNAALVMTSHALLVYIKNAALVMTSHALLVFCFTNITTLENKYGQDQNEEITRIIAFQNLTCPLHWSSK